MKSIFALVGLMGFVTLPLGAVVLVHALPEPLNIYEDYVPTLGSFFPYDIDGNGTIDFTFIADGFAVGLRTERANRLVIVVDPPPNLGGPVASLPASYLVTLNLQHAGIINWTSSDLLGGYVSPDELVANTIIVVSFSGYATQLTGRSVIGIEFEAEDGIHYGYFDVSPAPYIAPRITLHGWAWETQPGVAILAGQVPEPSTFAFLLVAGSAIFLRRRKE